MLSILELIGSYMIDHVIISGFVKKCAINFFQKFDDYLKDKTVMYNKDKIKINFKRSKTFSQSLKVGFRLYIN